MTAEHFRRIESFLDARINPLFDATAGSTHGFADDDASRALRALRHTVGREAAAAALCEDYEKEDLSGRQITRSMTDESWRTLSNIAGQWKDHPDFLPEFGLQPHQLATSSKQP
ncbi:hypothetical protein [Streptomyces sp. NPDC015680]|uniref:hypothetical protein n=1 Tax=Streptomyces sp. NPDC015680 TaxID=3364962 RepID=UPI0036FF0FA2